MLSFVVIGSHTDYSANWHSSIDRTWSKLLEAWQCRDKHDKRDDTFLLALTIGRDKETAKALIEGKILEAPSSFADAASDEDQLRLAARMAGPLPVYQIKTVIEKVRILPSLPQ